MCEREEDGKKKQQKKTNPEIARNSIRNENEKNRFLQWTIKSYINKIRCIVCSQFSQALGRCMYMWVGEWMDGWSNMSELS